MQVAASGAVIEANSGAGNVVIDNNIVLNSSNVGGTFNTFIGATKAYTLTVNGGISGASDVTIANSNAPGGKGTTIFNGPLTYTGNTYIESNSGSINQLGPGVSLPSGTALTFGNGLAGQSYGQLDLNGNSITVSSLSTNIATGQTADGLVNSNASSGSAITVVNTTGSAMTFAAPIGTLLAGDTDNLSLTLASGNTAR